MKLRPKLTYANVIATLALFLALGGGAYAATAIPRNSVGSKQLKINSVTGAKVKDGSLLATDFGAGQLPSGARGPAGVAGPTGPVGPSGPQGEAGAKGDRGATGLPGEPGPIGPRGLPGADGEKGATGPRGPQGATGEEGPAGSRGLPGATGEEGPAGPRGKTGTPGEDGARGERGHEGPEGPEGPTGPKGERGLRGEPGRQGEPGEEGPEGEPGRVVTVTRYGKEQEFVRGPLASYASCRKGEAVTGGGFDVLGFTANSAYNVHADRASLTEQISEEQFREEGEELEFEGVVFSSLGEGVDEEEEEIEEEGGPVTIYRAPKDGGSGTGWVASLELTGKQPPKATFRAYVNCAPIQATKTEVGLRETLPKAG